MGSEAVVVTGCFFGLHAGAAHAGDTIEYADGTLNPQEMTVEHWVAEAGDQDAIVFLLEPPDR